MILAIETSCDDTCAAVVSPDGCILSNVVSSQARLHDRYGGVVPEVASRHHLQLVNAAVDAALDDAGVGVDEIELVATTEGPGLIGALLVGVATAKALAAARELPFVPVDHLHGHVAANYLLDEPPDFPFVCLVASGGHTLIAVVEEHSSYRVIGETLDDAAGEAFDKGARLLGLPFPGGALLDELARQGDPELFKFPVGMSASKTLDFSFSGLKTSLVYRVKELGQAEVKRQRNELAAGYQRAICEQLVTKVETALERTGIGCVALAGGVAANSELRDRMDQIASGRDARLIVPPPELCTDNAAMIASAARFIEPVPFPDYLDYDAFATKGVMLHEHSTQR